MAVVIWVPPEAPTTRLTLPSRSTMMVGHMEESGCFPEAGGEGHRDAGQLPTRRGASPQPARAPHHAPGLMKLAGEGGTPNWLVMLGELKSSISSLNKIPLTGDSTLDPKLQEGHIRELGTAPPGLAPNPKAPTCTP